MDSLTVFAMSSYKQLLADTYMKVVNLQWRLS